MRHPDAQIPLQALGDEGPVAGRGLPLDAEENDPPRLRAQVRDKGGAVELRQGRFSAGADVRSALTGSAEERIGAIRDGAEAGRAAMTAVREMRPVTIALVHGRAIGGAMVLAAACDLRVATEDAVFWLPEVDLGIPVGWGGVPILVAELGASLARDLVLTCRRLSAPEAHRAGFISRLVAPEEGRDAARQLGLLVASKPAGATARSKQQFRAALAGSSSGAADAELIVAALIESGRTGITD